jgi:hypothetical protein
VLEARGQPILTCFETIRRQIMNRFSKKNAGAATTPNVICPKIVKKLERNKLEAKNYICRWSNQMQFEVDSAHESRRVVDLQGRTCGCGRWQLNGIPCPHAVCAIYLNKGKPETYVSHWYMMDTYRKSYASGICPMPGPDEWPVDEGVKPIEPPQPRKQRWRPKKQRKIGVNEQPDESIKVSRKGYDVWCGNCGEKGHNARSCREPDNPNRKKYPKQPRKLKVGISGRITIFLFTGSMTIFL